MSVLTVNFLQLHGIAGTTSTPAPIATMRVDELGVMGRLLSMVSRDTHENAQCSNTSSQCRVV